MTADLVSVSAQITEANPTFNADFPTPGNLVRFVALLLFARCHLADDERRARSTERGPLGVTKAPIAEVVYWPSAAPPAGPPLVRRAAKVGIIGHVQTMLPEPASPDVVRVGGNCEHAAAQDQRHHHDREPGWGGR